MNPDSLKKFKLLPPERRNELSSPQVLGEIEILERKYNASLAMLFISLAVGDLTHETLTEHLENNFSLPAEALSEISQKLSSLLGRKKEPVVPSKAGFVMFTDDEAEIKHFKSNSSESPSDFNSATAEIISRFGYNENDEILRRRLESIVIARLRDVRDELETSEALTKSRKIGGLELSESEAQRLIKLIREKSAKPLVKTEVKPLIFPTIKKPAEKVSLIEKKERDGGKNPLVEQVVKTVQERKENTNLPNRPLPIIKEENGLPVIQMPEEMMVKPKMTDLRSVLGKPVSPLVKPEEKIQPLPKPFPKISDLPKAKVELRSKPSLDDVKFVKKLVGPIEELSGMTLIDFRRLGDKPMEAIIKVKEKINLLEKDSYKKRIEGIEAWHKSEVNRFYRLLGQTSLTEGKNVEELISERLQAQKPTLSLAEFDAVMELNRDLRY